LKIGLTLIVISTQKVWEPDEVVPIVLEMYLEIPTPSVRSSFESRIWESLLGETDASIRRAQ
jgi:hypothetical protein